MTYASHARVITGIIQANLIHLSIKMTTPHQSGAPFVGERVFQNRGVCGQAFPSFPSPTPFLQPFCSRPIFARPGCEKLVRAARISFASYGNTCYAGYSCPFNYTRICWCIIETSSDLLRSSSAIFGDLRQSSVIFGKYSELFEKCSETFVSPS